MFEINKKLTYFVLMAGGQMTWRMLSRMKEAYWLTLATKIIH
jgi:hypothetical protein